MCAVVFLSLLVIALLTLVLEDQTAARAARATVPDDTSTVAPSTTTPPSDLPPGSDASWAVPVGDIQMMVATDDAVVVSDGVELLSAFVPADGSILWQRPLAGDLIRLAPIADGGLLVAESVGGRRTVLLDLSTGEERWRADGILVTVYDTIGDGATTLETTSDVVLLFDNDFERGNTIKAVDRTDGELLWQESGGDAVLCGDIVVTAWSSEGTIDGDQGPTTLRTIARDRRDGRELWASPGWPGACRDDEIGVRHDDQALVLGLDGSTHAAIELPPDERMSSRYTVGSGSDLSIVPLGADVIVPAPEAGSASTFRHPRDGSSPTVLPDYPHSLPLPDHLLVGYDELVSLGVDGSTSPSVPEQPGSCGPAVVSDLLALCDTTEVVLRTIDDLTEVGRFDARLGIDHVTAAGSQIVVVAGGLLLGLA